MSDERTPIERLGLEQRLVKAWRLRWPLGRSRYGTPKPEHEIGLYVHPESGLFYARVPETDEGTLYAADTLRDLRDEVEPARKAWISAHEEQPDLRTWERRIRVLYGGGEEKRGDIVTAEPASPARGGARYRGSPWRDPVDVVSCTQVGVLTFSRYERAPDPEGRIYDLREWAEDFDRRLEVWREADPRTKAHSLLTQDEHRRAKPQRGVSRESVTHRRRDRLGREVQYRDLPWCPDTWASLNALARRFGELHDRIGAFLLRQDDDRFLADLTGRLLLETRWEP